MPIHAITGAFGFSGKYIAKRLLDAGESVVTLTNSPERPNPFAGKIATRPLDFSKPEQLAESLQNVDILYNTYWVRFNHQLFNHADAVTNTLTLFDAAKKAGVSKIVHVSIANPNENSPLEYFKEKAVLEKALKESGLNYAIVRPAVLFGDGGILINNIAWTLRRFPVLGVFGDGTKYHVCPIYVDDLAKIMIEEGAKKENSLINALGPEDFSYVALVQMIGKAIGIKPRILSIPPALGYLASRVIGLFMGDIFVTREEIKGLMADLLHVQGATPTGTTRLSEWVKEHADTLGTRYASELARRKDRRSAY